jgi:hypothetical protein
MRRQANVIALRWLAKSVEGEVSPKGVRLFSRATASISNASPLTGIAVQGRASWQVPFAASTVSPIGGARLQSTSAEEWNTILYPESELEIGSPAPDFQGPGKFCIAAVSCLAGKIM